MQEVGTSRLPFVALFLSACLTAVAYQQPEVSSSPQESQSSESSDFPRPAGQVVLRDGQEVVLRNIDPITSNHSHSGEVVQFEVIRDVSSDGKVIIPEHAIAVGRVVTAEHAKLVHHGGKLRFSIESVQLANGDFAPLRAVESTQNRNFGWQDVGAATLIAATIYYMPLAPVYLMAKGEDVSITPGTRFSAYVDGEITVDASTLRDESASLPAKQDATIYVFRRSGDVLPDSYLPVSCGRALLGGLTDNTYMQFALPPGRYWVYADWPMEKRSAEKRQGRMEVVEAEAGHSYYLEVAYQTGKWKSAKATMHQVDAETGADQIFQSASRSYIVPAASQMAALTKPPRGVKPN